MSSGRGDERVGRLTFVFAQIGVSVGHVGSGWDVCGLFRVTPPAGCRTWQVESLGRGTAVLWSEVKLDGRRVSRAREGEESGRWRVDLSHVKGRFSVVEIHWRAMRSASSTAGVKAIDAMVSTCLISFSRSWCRRGRGSISEMNAHAQFSASECLADDLS